jgi:hypothetical protein
MAWDVEWTAEAGAWYRDLEFDDMNHVAEAIARLAEVGPRLGRPTVDRIKGSRYHHMKELRPVGGHMRALFAFDPRRVAVVLVGGDKTGDWTGWYHRHIRIADALYDDHLARLRAEGLI